MPESAPQPNNKKTESKEELSFRFASYSAQSEIVSDRHKENQDTHYESPGACLLADGVGGNKGGKTASQMVSDFLSMHLSEVKDGTTVAEAESALSKIFISADYAIKFRSEGDETLAGMATTAVLAKVFKDNEGKNWLLVPNVGNSRAYLIDRSTNIDQLTDDDDVFKNPDFQAMFNFTPDEEQKIKQEIEAAKKKEDLEGDALTVFTQRNVVGQVLGHGKAVPNISKYPVEKGDRIILVSDFYDNFSEQEFKDLIKEVLSSPISFDDIPKEIIKRAQERSKDPENFRAKADDMTVVLIEVV